MSKPVTAISCRAFLNRSTLSGTGPTHPKQSALIQIIVTAHQPV
ncbi:MAG: hypothetical protein R3F53_10440 [Gammaproteobacteria bacterium]